MRMTPRSGRWPRLWELCEALSTVFPDDPSTPAAPGFTKPTTAIVTARRPSIVAGVLRWRISMIALPLSAFALTRLAREGVGRKPGPTW